MTLNIVFMGTPAFSVPCLQTLIDHPEINLLAVLTQPDRPAGRGQKLTSPPVKLLAEAYGLAVYQPTKLRTDEHLIQHLRDLQPDFLVTIAFGQILPQSVLDIPRLGTINVHASLLPHYRGANPIQWAVLNGETETGLTTMLTELGVDTGPMLLTHRESIHATDTTVDLHDRLSVAAGPLLVETLQQLASHTLVPIPQDDAKATHAPKLAKTASVMDWTQPASVVDCRIRGQQPWPGASTLYQQQPLKLLASVCVPEGAMEMASSLAFSVDNPTPGSILGPVAVPVKGETLQGLGVQCGTGRVSVLMVQPAGKKAMRAVDWWRGLQEPKPAQFETPVLASSAS